MARFHGNALGRKLAKLLAKISLTLASTTLVASCAITLGGSRNGEARFANPRLIYLETSQ